MKLTPLHDWAVVRQFDEDEVTAGGLYIPDAAKQKSAEGVVEAIGPGAYEEEKRGRKKKDEKKERKFISTTVKPGDVVLYESYAGREVKVDGEDLVLVRERDILGTLIGRPEPKRAAAPLQIPRATTGQGNASLATRPTTAVAVKKAAAVPAKVSAKTVKKAEKKAAQKPAKKKAAAKPAKKAAKKAVLKTAKPKAPKKAAKKGTKKKR